MSTTLSLTPELLDLGQQSVAEARSFILSTSEDESHPTPARIQHPDISGAARWTSRTPNALTTNRSTLDSAMSYRCVPRTRSAKGKALIRLMPLFQEDVGDRDRSCINHVDPRTTLRGRTEEKPFNIYRTYSGRTGSPLRHSSPPQKSRIIVHKISDILKSNPKTTLSGSPGRTNDDSFCTLDSVSPLGVPGRASPISTLRSDSPIEPRYSVCKPPQSSAIKHYFDKKEVVQRMHSEVVEHLRMQQYRQAISKLYDCERFLYVQKIESSSLKMYTNYLIVLTYYKTTKYDKCIQVVQKAVENYQEFDKLAEEYMLHIKLMWGRALQAKGEHMAAAKVLSQLVEEYQKIFGGVWDNSVFRLESLLQAKSAIGECYLAANLVKDAIRAYQEVVTMVSPTWPIKKSTMYAEREDEYGSRVLNAWNQLGNCLVREGRPDRALDCYLKGEDHIRLFKIEVDDEIRAKLYLNIGKLFLQKKDYVRAQEYIEKSKDLRLKMHGESSAAALACYETIAYRFLPILAHSQVALVQEKYNDAYLNYIKCVGISGTINGEQSHRTAHYLTLAGGAKSRTMEFPEAIPLYERAVRICAGLFGPAHPSLAALHLKLVPLYLKTNQSQLACSVCDVLLKTLESQRDQSTVSLMSQLAETFLRFRHPKKAVAIFKLMLQYLKELYKGKYQSQLDTYRAYYGLGRAHMALGGDTATTYNYMSLALQVADAACGKGSVESAAAYSAIGKLYRESGDMYNARNHFKVAEDILARKENEKRMLEEVRGELMLCQNYD